MADWEFVDPVTGAALGAHAYGTVAAGTSSTPWSVKLRYKWGLSGSGVNSNALVLEISEDGGVTWRPAVTEFSVEITAIANPSNDPLFTERVRTLGRGSRWTLAPFRAGCSITTAVKFTPDLRTGDALQSYKFRLGIDPNVSFEPIGLVPDAPSGVLSGIGCPDVSECISAPTIVNGTDKVTMGAHAYVFEGIRYELAGGDVAHDQDDGDAATLAATEEYIAIQTVGASGRTVTKGSKAPAGTATAPAIPAGERPEATVRVPYGGVIVTSTLHAVSGRCAVSDAGGLNVYVQPGRSVVPGYLVTPPVVQTFACPDDATSTVCLSASGTANTDGEGAQLADVVTAGGDIVSVTDRRRLLGLELVRLRQVGNEATGTAVDRVYVPYPWAADSGAVLVRTASTGATGSTDVSVGSFASGSIAAQGTAAALTFTSFSGAAGWITLDVDAITSGGTRAVDVEVYLWIARRP